MANFIIRKIVEENARRNAEVYSVFNPISGFNSVGERKKVEIEDFPIRVQYLPVEMMSVPLVKQLQECGSIKAFLEEMGTSEEDYEADRQKVIQQSCGYAVGMTSHFGRQCTFTSSGKAVEMMCFFGLLDHRGSL